jgi:KRAB domain-containing zinc finger protein
VQRLSEEQILALSKPNSDGSLSHEFHVKNLESAEFLQTHVDPPSTPIPGIITCTFEQCYLIFTSSKKLKKHIREEHYNALHYSCDVCGVNFTRKENLKLHIQRRHSQFRTHACDFQGCSYSGNVVNDLKKHKERVHPSILYTCLLCGKNIKRYQNYKLHVAKHKTDTPGVLKCLHPKCKKVSKNGDDLRKHTEEVHEDVKRFQCNECGNFFASKKMVALHVVKHWDWRPFKCDTPGCFYSAKRSQDLQSHKNNVHTLDRFTCCYCGKIIKSRVRYKQHLEKHKKNTPGVIKCIYPGCKQTFKYVEDLRKHFNQAHTNV